MGNSTILFRRGVPADASRLADFGRRTFVETYGAHNTPEDLAAYLAATYGDRQQLRELEDDDSEHVIAEQGGDVVGFALLREGAPPDGVDGAHAIEIRRFYLAQVLHGSGVAAQLMSATVDAALRRGADTLWLGVWEENPRAIRFYQKQGFTTVGRLIFPLGSDGQTDLVMARSLSAS